MNMVDVGEETGELDTMLFKIADVFDEEVTTLTDGLMKLIEPLLIVFLGGAVGFIVISLFLPLISLIQGLSAAVNRRGGGRIGTFSFPRFAWDGETPHGVCHVMKTRSPRDSRWWKCWW